jgi:hypothetical protein
VERAGSGDLRLVPISPSVGVESGSIPGEPAKVDKLDLTGMPSARVELTDARGQRYELTFSACHRIQHPAPGDEPWSASWKSAANPVVWFAFRPAKPGGRVLAI